MNAPQQSDRLDYIYKLLVVIALLITATMLAADIVIPMAFAAFLAVVMLPAIKRMEKRKIGTALSITIVMFATLVILVLLMWLVINQVVSLINDLPNLQVRFENSMDQLSGMLLSDFGISLVEQKKLLGEFMRTVSVYLGDVLLTTTSAISTIIQIPIYIFLFLIYRDKFKQFFVSLSPRYEELG